MRLLCIRFSAIGDVAMTVPVVRSLALAYPNMEIIVVSRPFAKAFYEGLAPNIEFVGIDLKDKKYKGLMGMEHVYQSLKSLKPDAVADLHNVLRTKYARARFRASGISVAAIDKGRKGRKALCRQKDKELVQQPTSFKKYQAVFQKLGFDFPLLSGAPVDFDSQREKMIGVAPFAAHQGKIYPVEKTEEMIGKFLLSHPDFKVALFGGGKKEKDVFNSWKAKYNGVFYAGDVCKGLRDELNLMQKLECMVSMDSGNMHMASLVGTPVISVWGATHPLAGFMGWGQSDDDAVQIDMPCRPCSIYGNKPCLRGDYACLNNITPDTILVRIEKYI